MKQSVLGKETSLYEGPEGGRALGLSELPQAEHLVGSLREQVGQGQTAGGLEPDCLGSGPSNMP